MIKYEQHIPGFIDGVEPEKYSVKTLDELLKKNKRWLKKDFVFATDEEGETLMISSTVESWWWVLGFVEGIDLRKHLPIFDEVYIPSAKGVC